MIGGRFTTFGVIAGVVLAIMFGLYWKGRLEGAAGQRPKVVAAEARAKAAALETSGERASAVRVDAAVRQQSASLKVTHDLALEALKSEDAHVPLEHDRVLRLRDADDELCRLAPELAGCEPPY